ncbi:MAG: hypothetical protein UU88_C0011G0009 [Parcubacteria group bacterium GW2011_GWC1_42_11]|uniref:Uncharacterized protein n=1 Tax=Candidatus Nomurabacteria bacterium GW2011_GWC2_42_20 TaxID=1618756 RepID=A0A0G0ZH23_9BACT|nr:MAG: hypothetical protein UU88_C0011G0009 [Parcubacteria group bacterium GW2011_GWC1_42_11]KKS48050.1 MAG: hypothetical protein UV12_C0003G0009 [Candidatus Nomurabacteria bacterium GW2011_GWC2_42_20]KKS59180.1 MAG: hypothetical protein UV24_C0005G0015 [Candidatus Nomurabacteria bacterium GW2011_GWA2_42_41]KKT09589.1 MAG: hypothetical protein UV86_C0004G0008 [Candidatus Nomurabacteria bacterium GW2011_GWB1_43_20]HBH71380.1 hypothetical protein [Candidatus Yonathbacteria bacterium]
MLDENPARNECDEWMRISKTNELLGPECFVLVKNNFHLHFANNFVGRIYREQNAYKECFKGNSNFPRLAEYLIARGNRPSIIYIALLYEAYKMMRIYAESNWEMFQ